MPYFTIVCRSRPHYNKFWNLNEVMLFIKLFDFVKYALDAAGRISSSALSKQVTAASWDWSRPKQNLDAHKILPYGISFSIKILTNSSYRKSINIQANLLQLLSVENISVSSVCVILHCTASDVIAKWWDAATQCTSGQFEPRGLVMSAKREAWWSEWTA